MKHILVPIGSSENAPNTLQYAIDLAEIIKADVFVFRAYQLISKAGAMINLDEIMERETNLYMRSIINFVDRKNVTVKLITAKGNDIDTIASIDKKLGIDLIVLGPKSNSNRNDVFLGNTSGGIVKKTTIPALIVPESYAFKRVNNILAAFKSGILTKENVLNPLTFFINTFSPKVNLLLVKTPNHTKEDLVLDKKLEALNTSFTTTENATTFQGVLANFTSINPDMLCVFRRNRGFFKKLWEKNTILKEEFDCKVPLLVLNGMK